MAHVSCRTTICLTGVSYVERELGEEGNGHETLVACRSGLCACLIAPLRRERSLCAQPVAEQPRYWLDPHLSGGDEHPVSAGQWHHSAWRHCELGHLAERVGD